MTSEVIEHLRQIENRLDYGHLHWFTNNDYVYFDNISDLEKYAFSHGMMNCLEYAVSCKKILDNEKKHTKTRILKFSNAYGLFRRHFVCGVESNIGEIYLGHPNLMSKKELSVEIELEEALKKLEETRLQLEDSNIRSSLVVYGKGALDDFFAGSIFLGNEDPESDEHGLYLGDVVIERYRSLSGARLDVKRDKGGNVKYVELLDRMTSVFSLSSKFLPPIFLSDTCVNINKTERVNSSDDLKKLAQKYLGLRISDRIERYTALFSMLDEKYMEIRRNQVFQ